MAMRRASYVPVPDELLIWGGDDWLFYAQEDRRNLRLHGGRIATEMSTTVNSTQHLPETAAADLERYIELYRHTSEQEYRARFRSQFAIVGFAERVARISSRVLGRQGLSG